MTRPVTPGRLVAGRYRLQSRIGGGGMGTVWMARDERLGRTVAVKQLLPPEGTDPAEAEAQRQRVLREGRIAARLSNPHAISAYDVAQDDGLPWLVMEYLPSRSLAAVLEQDGVLRVDQVAQIGAQVADALAATHAAGIVHRDVKPANILIGHGERVEGLVKITDFGISHAAGDVTLTRTGQITGTPAFLSPEVAQGHQPTPVSDVFSLGATLYTCLEGEPPFGMGDNTLQQLHRVAAGQITPPRQSGRLTEPLLRMLAVDPAARPSMAQAREALARVAAGRDGDTATVLLSPADLRAGPARTRVLPPPPPRTRTGLPAAPGRPAQSPGWAAPPEPGDGPRRRRAGIWVAVGAIVALLVLGGVYALASSGGNGGSAATGTTTSSTSSASSSPATSSAATTPPASPTATTPATTAAPPPATRVQAKDVRDFLRRYHDLLPEKAQSAWALTGPTLRSTVSEQDYLAFWQQFSDVRLSDVQAQDGSLVATGTLQFTYRGGRKQTEQHRFTLVVGDRGQLLLDSDRAVS